MGLLNPSRNRHWTCSVPWFLGHFYINSGPELLSLAAEDFIGSNILIIVSIKTSESNLGAIIVDIMILKIVAFSNSKCTLVWQKSFAGRRYGSKGM